MNCPKCDSKTKVIDTSGTTRAQTRRRHECLVCKHRFTTYELLSDDYHNLDVVTLKRALREAKQAIDTALTESSEDDD